MAHYVSASALHTARVILASYELTPRPPETLVSGSIPGLTSSEAHVSVVIDFACNVFHLANLRPEMHYWHHRLHDGTATASQIAGFLKKCLAALEAIPKDNQQIMADFEVPRGFAQDGFAKQVTRRPLSKPAREVARFVFHYYFVKPKAGSSNEDVDRINIARLAEGSLGLVKALQIVPMVETGLKRLMEGHATETETRKCLREIGVLLEQLPQYQERLEEGKVLV